LNAYLPLLSVLIALLIGLAVGKAWERYKLRDGRWIDRRRLRETPHYMLGLNFLVDNQVDHAIDELAQATSTDTDALEIQMILGNLYRQKGQVGRAINVHQALLKRPDLTKLEHAYVLLCLGLDYRERGQRAAPVLFPHFRRALEEPRVEVEYVSGISLAAGGTPQEERELAVRPSVFREVIVNDKRMPSGITEVFA